MNSTMGQIPCCTERISFFYMFCCFQVVQLIGNYYSVPSYYIMCLSFFTDQSCLIETDIVFIASDSPIVSAVAHYGVHYGRMNSHIARNAFFAAPVMTLIFYALLDVWSDHIMLNVFVHSLERLCCFYSSCCSLEIMAVVVPCCHRMKLMSLFVYFNSQSQHNVYNSTTREHW